MTLEHAANAIIFVGHVARVPADDGERTYSALAVQQLISKLSGSLHYCCTCPNKNIISTCALAIFTACIVGAEAKSIRMRVDISGEDNQDEGRFRNLKSERGFAEDEERSELSLKLINALKSFFGFKTKLTSTYDEAILFKAKGQKVASEISKTKFTPAEAKSLQKVASDVSKTKFTPAETKNLQKATRYVAEGKLTKADLKSAQHVASEIVKKPKDWTDRLVDDATSALLALVIVFDRNQKLYRAIDFRFTHSTGLFNETRVPISRLLLGFEIHGFGAHKEEDALRNFLLVSISKECEENYR
ncbi:hypothetical protein PHYSODRAFT_308226 [Phytophthora sojae]|uniref:Uncharacterized protein n=1 Tax=Phytophthora sojae (strain P6497) TaxID=1094619 RepID=G5AIY6_PHYSP|nr:hypothetical protein PHYSODRAFT_306701 [Phytophthora sojae]XP_009540037.1 hypothetical protein PHYSODRAFT_308226 [Phytophthora sojae]EGZ04541.1 hypothetical protein PHYSODRAFT_308226 [Phytophthora sojae]EGZ07585.1 hypothetical protein PHYSODRAFT_306701 [Phytophthora sojae]|eukprot:XP_009537151.1 hypothetical protein PHYSODRAFT_306701 [Phytophthora sojae]